MHPLVSLILTTYNSEEHLSETLDSIGTQDYSDIEIIIKDGGSTDNTEHIVNSYIEKLRYPIHFYVKSDSGIYDAMNQGFSYSSGDIILFFNDRFLKKDVVSRMVSAIEVNDSDGAHADLMYMDGDKPVRYWHMGNGRIRDGWMPGHPTLFLKRSVFEKYGLFKTDYRISADYEFMVRILRNDKVRLIYVPEVMVVMYYGGTSSEGLKSYLVSFKEAIKGLKENEVRFPFIVSLKRTARVLKQFFVVNGYKMKNEKR